ncbi:hypothetical protein UFOVP9_27 [uncultured Caudovirales phage]|uniref:Uncharacterized protein n=1 Tax=uncultured Caudovirales phage TaxID=2100421 RepID=A0A6J5KGU5_9CAUD|nr:hypothetical protein UFOVP9_27 [uncultured Caudovirales phage]
MEIKSFVCQQCFIEFPNFEKEMDINGDEDNCRLCVWEWILSDYRKHPDHDQIIEAYKEIIKILKSRLLYK